MNRTAVTETLPSNVTKAIIKLLCHSQGGLYTHLTHEVANILEQYSLFN